MSYDDWIAAVIRIGEEKNLRVTYFEGPRIGGKRAGHFEGYCDSQLRVWAGCGEELPEYGTSPRQFAGWWPECKPSRIAYEKAPVIAPVERDQRPTGGKYIFYRVRRAVSASMKKLFEVTE